MRTRRERIQRGDCILYFLVFTSERRTALAVTVRADFPSQLPHIIRCHEVFRLQI